MSGALRANACFLLFAPLIAGCAAPAKPATADKPRAAGAANVAPSVPAPADNEKLSPEVLALIDPCAMRLEDVAGALLNYYRVNGEFPEKLQDADATAPGGIKVGLTCPVSKQPYGYAPSGLQSLGRGKRILVYDPTPAHDGKRWCILFAVPKGNAPPYLEVLPITDQSFATYLPVAEHLNTP